MTSVEQLRPFYYVVTRPSLALFGDAPALRIPSLLGFLLACSCLVVTRRTNA